MLLYNRRIFLGGLLALGGCGFTPAFGPNSAAAGLRGRVMIDAPDTRDGFEFVKAMQRNFGVTETAEYRLTYTLTKVEDSTVVSVAQELQRFAIEGRVQFTLQTLGGQTVVTGENRAFTSYSATGSTLATDRSQRDAEDRLMVILADQVMTDIIAGLNQ
ncbi:MAG: LPS assembly lipoprotein LptE [Planktomarina sp.]